MQPSEEKLAAFKAAKDFLSRSDDSLSRHAALELRRCIEAVVYETLLAYRSWIPANVARTWQPPQAFKALLAIHPDAQETKTVAVGKQTHSQLPSPDPYKQLGVDYRPKYAWLSKTWNKLGSLLHASWPFAQSSVTVQRAFLERVLSDLEPFVSTTLTVAFTNTIEFNCSECGYLVRVSEESAETTGEATCLKCESRFLVKKTANGITFHLDGPSFICQHCEYENRIPTQNVKVGYTFSCVNCKVDFEIVAQVWQVRSHLIPTNAITCLAYELWERRGCPRGSPEVDWFEAERQLRDSTNRD